MGGGGSTGVQTVPRREIETEAKLRSVNAISSGDIDLHPSLRRAREGGVTAVRWAQPINAQRDGAGARRRGQSRGRALHGQGGRFLWIEVLESAGAKTDKTARTGL